MEMEMVGSWKWWTSWLYGEQLEPEDDIDEEIVASEDEDEDGESKNGKTAITHTVVFKCIGASRDPACQQVLAMASQQLKQGKNVEVQLQMEPTNAFDSRAVQIVCKLNDKWERIGYVVREALDAVHDAINKNEICSVEFSWVKYLLHWSRSGPGGTLA